MAVARAAAMGQVLVSELVAVANTVHAGSYSEGLMNVAGRIAEKSLGGQAFAATAR